VNPREARAAFLKEFRTLTHRWSPWDVWSDWLIMASNSIYNSIHRDQAVEEEYLRTAKRYSADEMTTMANLIGITVQGLEAEVHDFLGATFHELEMHNKQIGQFFTPFELCKMMARMMRPDPPKPGQVLKVAEPAAGSGSMVLAFHEVMIESGVQQGQIYYSLKDLDHRAFRMSYIQTSLCGLAAEVVLGDTLRGTNDRVWRTPGYYLHDMPNRLRVDAMLRAIYQGDDHAAALPERIPKDVHQRIHPAPDGDPPAHDDQGAVQPDDGHAHRQGDPAMDPGPEPESQEGVPEQVPMVPDLILPRVGEQFALF